MRGTGYRAPGRNLSYFFGSKPANFGRKHMSRHRKWSEEDIAKLKSLARRYPTAQISVSISPFCGYATPRFLGIATG
jgi:hypothetical protein